MTDENTLRRHVRHSNLIERIIAFPGEPLYESHLAAARLADSGNTVRPNELHRALGQGTDLEPHAGRYRTGHMHIGGHTAPGPEHVRALMEDWEYVAGRLADCKDNPGHEADLLHMWLLCIHPWEDGNGRAARLMLNMLCRSNGLPWRTIPASIAGGYYYSISYFEEHTFRKMYPDVYTSPPPPEK